MVSLGSFQLHAIKQDEDQYGDDASEKRKFLVSTVTKGGRKRSAIINLESEWRANVSELSYTLTAEAQDGKVHDRYALNCTASSELPRHY